MLTTILITTILITAAVAMPVGYLVGRGFAGIEWQSKYDDLYAAREETKSDLRVAQSQLDHARNDAYLARSQLARLTDRDERGRFVRREVDNGARPQEGRFKL